MFHIIANKIKTRWMDMKKLLLILLFVINIFAADEEKLISMVMQNPSLLDTPQGEMLLKQYGLTKEQVTNMINNKKSSSGDKSAKDSVKTKNNIVVSDNNESDIEALKLKEEIKDKLLSEYEKIIDQELDNKITLEREEKLKELQKEKAKIHPFEYINSETIMDDLKKKQHKKEAKELKRFSDGFFANKNQIDPTSLPVPEWYEISINDGFLVTLFGIKNESYNLKVKSDGTISIPSYGPLQIAGKSYKDAEQLIKDIFKRTFPNNSVVVTIDQYSTMQVSITGDVKAPGVYNLSSLSTLKEALVAANGVNATGSVREIEIKRNGRVFKKIDLYDFIISGNSKDMVFLKANDVVFVPVAKNLVKIEGEVKREAIYELKQNQTLFELLEIAGGLTQKANKEMISIARYGDDNKIAQLSASQKDAKSIALKDMDSIYVYPINEENSNSVFVYGNVFNPGVWEFSSKTKSVGALFNEYIKKDSDIKNLFLPNTFFEYGIIKRYDKNLSYKIIKFNLQEELDGASKTELLAQDEIYIFDNKIINGSEFVEILGEPILKPGKYMYFDGMSVEDLIYAAGAVEGAIIDKEKIKVRSASVNIKKTPFYKLSPYDDVVVYDENLTKPRKYANIYGEIVKQGAYEINESSTLMDLVQMAGGLTQKAARNKIEITKYIVKDNVREKILKIYDKDIDELADLSIDGFDEVRIFKIPKWNERQSVVLKGEVKYPGEYVIYTGERLYDVIKRAGGFTEDAFLEGSIFSRESLRISQQKELKNSLFTLKQNITSQSLSATQYGGQRASTAELVSLIAELERQADEYAPQGRIALEITQKTVSNVDSPNNIILEDKDVLYVPSKLSTVTIIGEVLSQSTVVYQEGAEVEDYINLAGGLKESANEDAIFIIHANGMTEKASKGWFAASATVKKGDSIFVPPTIDTFSNIAAAKDITSIIYQMALAAASLKVIGAL